MSDVAQALESTRARIGRWAAAAIVVCAVHTGAGSLALMSWPDEEDADDPAGALTLEMAPLPAAAPANTRELAHGPDEQAKPRPEAAKQAVEKVKEDIPPVAPSPAPEPEVALPMPQPEAKEKPKEAEPPEATARDKTPPQEPETPIATAPPRVEAQPAPRPAPSPGRSASKREVARWQNGLVRRIDRFKHYPEAADRRGIKGVATVRFTVDRSGRVVAAEVLKSSGSPILDKEAVALTWRASPFPAPPDGLPDELLESRFLYRFE